MAGLDSGIKFFDGKKGRTVMRSKSEECQRTLYSTGAWRLLVNFFQHAGPFQLDR